MASARLVKSFPSLLAAAFLVFVHVPSRTDAGIMKADADACPTTFKSKPVSFKYCFWLDSEHKFRLAWSPPAAAGGAFSTYFSGPPEQPNGWAGWGIAKDSRGSMIGSNVVVGYANPAATSQVKALPYYLSGIVPSSWGIGTTNSASFQVDKSSIECEISDSGNLVAVQASIKGLDSGPQTVTWRGGQGVQDFATGYLLFHQNRTRFSETFDFGAGTLGAAGAPPPAGGGTPPSLAQPPSTGPCLTNFRGKYMLHPKCAWLDGAQKFRLAWTPSPDKSQVHIFFHGTPEVPYGWAGWGVASTSDLMVGSNVVVGIADPTDNSQVKALPYYLAGSDPSKVMPNTNNGGFQLVPNTLQVEFIDGGSVVKVRANFTFPVQGPVTVLWQGGPGVADFGAGTLVSHQLNTATTRDIDFFTGSVGGASSKADTYTNKLVHAWMAGLGFGVLMPIGILVARHVKLWADPLWFYSHIALQFLGYTVGVIGWGFGIWLSLQTSSSAWPQKQFAHYCIGVTIFCTATLQILTPAIKPHKGSPQRLFWNLAHWGLGYSTVILSIANIFLGFWIFSYQNFSYGPWQTVYIVYIAVWGGLMVLLEPLSWYLYLQHDDSDEEHEDDEDEKGEEEDEDEDEEGGKKKYYDDD